MHFKEGRKITKIIWSERFKTKDIENNLKLAYKQTIKRFNQMQPHQQRVVDELTELQDKINKLNSFIESDKFESIVNDTAEIQRLIDQRHCMQQYSLILNERIENFK